MASFLDKFKIDGSKLETPLAIRHVESHLVWGPISRYFPAGYLMCVAGIWKLIDGLGNVNRTATEQVLSIALDIVAWIIVFPFILLCMTRRQQAISGWIGTKLGFGIAAFMMMTLGTLTSYQRGQYTDAIVFFLLGLIWLPSLEFIPRLTPHQKWITLARLILSVPLVKIGIQGGNWHWD